MPLKDLQQAFQAYLLEADPAIAAHVSDAALLDRHQRLAVYAEAYGLRLVEALATDYKALRDYLGIDGFERLARAYMAAHPSDHYSLRHFGRHLPVFLHAQWPGDGLAAELAAFEWALVEAFDAADEPVLGCESLAEILPQEWPPLRFRTPAACLRIDLAWNAPALRLAHDAGSPLPHAERQPSTVPWLVWRQRLCVYFRSLAPDEAAALDGLRRGADFAAICETLLEHHEAQAVAARAAGLLRQWATDGLLTEIVRT